ncbi:MAG: efflux RND transporter periplasmic adaptor subunit [Verrucomicrobia bacterium]|nr:efflux RND transporter periplasmic adaptor subunit [Verrucomicrobiota bacterium]
MKSKAWLIAGVAALVAAGAALVGCSEKADAKASAKKARPPVPVLVTNVVERPMAVQVRAIGNVEALATVSVRSQVDGQLLAEHFREGQEVKKGDLLFTIDPRPFAESLKQAEANLTRDKAQLENARLENQRYEELGKKGVASPQDADKVRATYAALRATVQADEAAVSNAKLQLGYTEIRSPIDGRTGNLRKDAGNVIKAKDDELVVINQVQPIYVTFSVPEHHLPDIKRFLAEGALPVEAVVANHEELRAQGQLTFVNNTVDVATGAIQLKATFPNTDRILWPGQFVNVRLDLTTQPRAIVVPSQAVQAGQQGEFVFVVKSDRTIEMRPVVLAYSRNGVAVIERGLRAGEVVVTDGHLRLVPGAKVDVRTSISPVAAGPTEAKAP